MSSKLTRQQLAKFLPDELAIRKFEALMSAVEDVIPSSLADALALVGSGKAPNIDRALRRIEELEILVSKTQNLDALIKRIEQLENTLVRSQNLDVLIKRIEQLEYNGPNRTPNTEALINRIEALEVSQHHKPNESSLLARIEALEKIVGV